MALLKMQTGEVFMLSGPEDEVLSNATVAAIAELLGCTRTIKAPKGFYYLIRKERPCRMRS